MTEVRNYGLGRRLLDTCYLSASGGGRPCRTKELLAELLLSEVCKLAGKSQTELARVLDIKQPSLSKLENQDDMQIPTLKKIIEALGGKVQIIASFLKATVRIKQFDGHSRTVKQVRELQLV